MDRDDAPLFGYIRSLSAAPGGAPVAQDALRRVEAFLATRVSRQVAARAVAVIMTPGLTDAVALATLRELAAPPAARALADAPASGAPASGAPASGATPLAAIAKLRPISELRKAPPASPSKAPTKKAPHGRQGAPCCGAPSGGRERSRLKDVAAELRLVRACGEIRYLDVGCAEGHITAAVAEELGIPPQRAHACDVAPQKPSAAFTFSRSGADSLPYGEAAFDFATMFMAAHHFADARAMFAEARRVLRAGGLLLIRDHDCAGEPQRLFYDVVHALYACVLGSEATPEEFVAQYGAGTYAHYRSAEEWVRLAGECGFEPHPEAAAHGPVIQGRYGSDRFDSFYVLLRAA